ncbi:hypothetical protein ACFSC4_31170 [Deinococcus malanensis]|uniref:hypothetical protein n=1 Tax=Deinococcus malanensis TaxID=1706855 RepID=UPI00363B7D1A
MTDPYSFALTYLPTGEVQTFTVPTLRSELIHLGLAKVMFAKGPQDATMPSPGSRTAARWCAALNPGRSSWCGRAGSSS